MTVSTLGILLELALLLLLQRQVSNNILIQTLGRWSSKCYTRYIRTNLQVIKDAQRKLDFSKKKNYYM